MKKILPFLTLMLFSSNAWAGVSPACGDYFKLVDGMLQAEQKKISSPGVAVKIQPLLQQYESSKKQIETMPPDQQEKVCRQGLEMMKHLKKDLEQKHE